MKNLLVITADHMRHDAIGCNGNAFVQTPNIDRLASGGVTFANSFTPDPICVPARASITTGCYPHRATGLKANSGRIRDDVPKIAEHFAAAGFRTYAIGKLHYVPYAPPGEPRLLHGFGHAELCEEGRILNQYDPEGKIEGLEDYHDYLKSVGWGGYERAHGVGNNDVHPSPSPVPAEHHEEAWVANRSMAILKKHKTDHPGQPFFLWASFTKPHSPYDPPHDYARRYDPRDIPAPIGEPASLEGRDRELERRAKRYGWDRLSPEGVRLARAYYYGLVTFHDEMVGRILQRLEDEGLADDTVVVYTADHGDLLGDFGRFFKTCFYDGAVKIPLIVRAPGAAPEGEVRDHLVGLQDILPTACALTGAPAVEGVDGMDLSDILRNDITPGRDAYVAQTGGPPYQKYMIRTAQWKYIYCQEGPTEELYDVTRDPQELNNLAGNPAYHGQAERLRNDLVHWCIEHGDESMLDGGKLAETPPVEEETTFNAGSMGWRWY